MKTSSQSQVPSSRGRLALRKPATWLAGVLMLAIAGFLGWRHAARNETVSPFPMKPATAIELSSIDRLKTGTERQDMEGDRHSATSSGGVPSTDGYDGQLAIAELTRQLNAEGLSRTVRQRAALALARSGSDTAVRALKAALASGSPELQEIIAESLGQCAHAESGAILEGLLSNANEPVVMAAIRSLSQQASSLAVVSLSQLLNDEQQSVNVRAEAAAGLGTIARPEALAALARATAEVQDEDVASMVIRGIAGRPVEETSAFLQAFLAAPHVSADLKVEALEGLSQATGEATPLLLNYLKDKNPELRAAAAWALSTLDTRGNAGAEIIALLGDETDPLVRKRLYQALDNQENFDLNAAWTLATRERNPKARIASLELFASAVEQTPSSEMIAFFDQHVLLELKNAALNGGTKDERLAAVMALRRAWTANAANALREIAAQTSDSRVAAATGITPSAQPGQ